MSALENAFCKSNRYIVDFNDFFKAILFWKKGEIQGPEGIFLE